MARGEGLYSRVIALLKILLPLIALALLSTLFLLSRSKEQMTSVPFADVVPDSEGARERVGAPYYAGTTDAGDMLTMTARSASPQAGGNIRAEDLSARLRRPDGSEILLNADHATLLNDTQRAILDGGVEIESTTGYTVQTETLDAALDRVQAESAGPVQGQGPIGTIEAGKLRIEPLGEGGDVQLLFTDGVKLIYLPQE